MILTNPMLKNIKKYNDIKFAKGLILNNSITKERKGEFGISSEQYSNKWFMLPKGRAIFKTYKSILDDDLFKGVKNMRLINELLCYELSKQVGILCGEYELATKNNTTGLVTYDIVPPGQMLIDSYDFFSNLHDSASAEFFINYDPTLEDYADAIDIYQASDYKMDKDKTLKTIYKIALFDCLTIQSDRHNGNLFFLVNEEKRTVKVAPILDNEFAFNLKYFDKYIHRLVELKKTPQDSFNESLDYLTDQINIQNYSLSMNPMFIENAKQLVNIALQNEEYAKIFKQVIKDFDLKKAINNVKAKGVTISPEYEEYMLMADEQIKKLLRKFVAQKKQQQNPKSQEYDYDFLKLDNNDSFQK